MRTLILFFAGLAVCFAANPAGDWHGTLKTGGPELRLVLHVQQTGEGAFQATLDSIDQGANGIPVSGVKLQGNHLTLDVQAVKGGYEGAVSEDGKTITGTWSQGGRDMPLTFTHGAAPKTEVPEDTASVAPLLGIWEGTLDTGAVKLRLRFTLSKNDKGQIQGGFDSIDQGANGIPMSGMKLNDSKFHFDLRAVGGTYDGTVSSDRKSIQGTWRQGGTESPLTWKKVD
jgi:hypothetical protein